MRFETVYIFLIRLIADVALALLLSGCNTKESTQAKASRRSPATVGVSGAGEMKKEGERTVPGPRVPRGCRAVDGSGATVCDGKEWAREVVHLSSEIELVLIPAGEFTMGSDRRTADIERRWREGDRSVFCNMLHQPKHTVVIRAPFYLGKYEVTNAQYQKFIEETGYDESEKQDWEYALKSEMVRRRARGPRYPVEYVCWWNAKAFCTWAGGRLPREAEWEYACRAGTQTEFYFGEDGEMLDEYAWWVENSMGDSGVVGQKKPNAWGLHDMYGNVAEWCEDCDIWCSPDELDFAGRRGGSSHPSLNYAGAEKARRGGSYWSDRDWCSSAAREEATWVSQVLAGSGFRIVLELVTVRGTTGGKGDGERG